MQDHVFEKLRTIVQNETGIALREDKRELLANRLSKRLRALKLTSEMEYLQILETETEPDELLAFIDAVSTNVTHFFREEDHFTLLAELLRGLHGDREIKIWCAAAATGEEPYTLAMIALDVVPDAAKRCRILATDISYRALKKAIEGVYHERQIEKIPRALLTRCFTPERGEDGRVYRAKPELRDMITFRRMNLSQFPYPLRGPLHFVFCRNVMIYFDLALRAKMAVEFERLLMPGGHLFIGHSENLLGIRHSLASVKPSVFKKARRC